MHIVVKQNKNATQANTYHSHCLDQTTGRHGYHPSWYRPRKKILKKSWCALMIHYFLDLRSKSMWPTRSQFLRTSLSWHFLGLKPLKPLWNPSYPRPLLAADPSHPQVPKKSEPLWRFFFRHALKKMSPNSDGFFWIPFGLFIPNPYSECETAVSYYLLKDIDDVILDFRWRHPRF